MRINLYARTYSNRSSLDFITGEVSLPKANFWYLWRNFLYRPDALPVAQPTASKHL